MTSLNLQSWSWKIPVAGLGYAVGAMLGGAALAALGHEMPQLDTAARPAVQMGLLFFAGMAMALGLAAMATGLGGRWWRRLGLLFGFVFVVYCVANALEGSIFTTIPGQWVLLWINAAAVFVCALLVTLLVPGRPVDDGSDRIGSLFSQWSAGGLLWRLGLAILAFPFVYLLFGIMVAPIVVPHYARLDFLVVPPMTTILPVLFVRSALFLLVSLPIVAAWRRSRWALVAALGLGHFVAVGFAGLVQTTMFPAVLRWTHGIEILADSFCYAWILVWLFVPRPQATGDAQGPAQRQPARRYA